MCAFIDGRAQILLFKKRKKGLKNIKINVKYLSISSSTTTTCKLNSLRCWGSSADKPSWPSWIKQCHQFKPTKRKTTGMWQWWRTSPKCCEKQRNLFWSWQERIQSHFPNFFQTRYWVQFSRRDYEDFKARISSTWSPSEIYEINPYQ